MMIGELEDIWFRLDRIFTNLVYDQLNIPSNAPYRFYGLSISFNTYKNIENDDIAIELELTMENAKDTDKHIKYKYYSRMVTDVDIIEKVAKMDTKDIAEEVIETTKMKPFYAF